MTIYRADPPEVDTIDIEVTKKGGKNLGLGFFTSNPQGLLVTDIVILSSLSRFVEPFSEIFHFLDSRRHRRP